MKLACITGASSGIGKEFAYLLSDLEYDLILVGRNTAALHEIADNVAVRCKCITCDLSDEKSCVKLGRKLRQYPLDIMINNAGFGELGTFAETKLKNDINMINVNIKAVHILTKAVLPGFIQRDGLWQPELMQRISKNWFLSQNFRFLWMSIRIHASHAR